MTTQRLQRLEYDFARNAYLKVREPEEHEGYITVPIYSYPRDYITDEEMVRTVVEGSVVEDGHELPPGSSI